MCMVAAAYALSIPLARIFVSYDAQLLELTVRAFHIFSLSFLFSGMAIYGSCFFTALNDGLTSIAAVLLLPLVWGIDGIWASIVVAEAVAASFAALFLMMKRGKYHY